MPPAVVADAVADGLAKWRSGQARPPDYDGYVATAREAWARLAGVAPANVATGASVSQLISLVAASLPAGSRVLVRANEFTSVTFPFVACGHEVTEVAAEELLSSMDGQDLVAVSPVQSADGALLDLDALRRATAAAGTRVLLDVTQTLGWLPVELGWADWVVGGCYKWLLSPRGAAWLACRADTLELIRPAAANWYAAPDPWQGIYGLPLRLADEARRLDLSPVWFSQLGSAVALSWLAGLDLVKVREHCVGLADAVLAGLGLPPAGSAIISLDLTERQASGLAEAGVAASVRAGRTRLSFHLYNTVEDVDLVLDRVRVR